MTIRHVLATAVFGLATIPSRAQTTVKNPWVRGTVPLQKASVRFAQIISVSGGKP